jgi:rod shape determining protein RodA
MIRKFFEFDFIFFFAVILLIGFGSIALWSILFQGGGAGNEIFTRHIIYAVIGCVIFIMFGLMDYGILKSYSTFLYFGSIGLLITTIVFGTTLRGTSGWLNLGFAYIQPVEIVKIFMVIFLAHFISKKRGELGEVTTIIVSFLLTAVVGFLYQVSKKDIYYHLFW